MKIAFYGTLRQQEKVKTLFGVSPVVTVNGHIIGELYEIIDETEPHGVYRYPILDIDGFSKIFAVLMQFNLEEKAASQFMSELQEYEGPSFELVEVTFFSTEGNSTTASCFTLKRGTKLENVSSRRLEANETILWE